MRACFCLVLCVAIAACGDDSGVSVNTNESNVCSQVAEVACHNLFNCCSESEIEDFLGLSERPSEGECRQDVERLCERSSAEFAHSFAQGRVTFDANIMNNCLAALLAPSGTCAEILPEQPWAEACARNAWVGTVAVDGECRYDFECEGAPDAYCAPNQVCKRKPGHGQPCTGGCAHEFYCDDNICQPRLPEGGICESTSQCVEDLFCDFNAVPMPVCTARQPAGAACLASTACESGECIPGTCAGPTPNNCYEDTDCNGRCADDGSFCTTAANCATGTCMLSGFSCTTPTACGIEDTCVFPVQCLPGECIGDPFCAAPEVLVDYCEGTLTLIPGAR